MIRGLVEFAPERYSVAEALAPDGQRLRVMRFEDPSSGLVIAVIVDQASAHRIAAGLDGRQIIVAPPNGGVG